MIREADQLHPAFAAAFNAADHATLVELFEPRAIFVTRPGDVIAGAEREQSLRDFLRLGLPIELTSRQTYVSGDLALLISDHRIEGTTPGGGMVRVEGTSADVARRGVDGAWRIVIDNPPGTA